MERVESGLVYLGIVLLTLAILDNWMGLFFALNRDHAAAIAAFSIFRDQPSGDLQRVALAVLGFTWFGTCLGHLGAIANDPHYRAYLILILVTVELNDVFAFVVGKTLGRRKLIPNTSPNKNDRRFASGRDPHHGIGRNARPIHLCWNRDGRVDRADFLGGADYFLRAVGRFDVVVR